MLDSKKKKKNFNKWGWGRSQDGGIRGHVNSPLPTNTSKICLQMEQFSQKHLLNTIRGPQKPKRTRKIPAYLGRTNKEKEKRGNCTGPAPLGGKLKERRGSHTWGSQVAGRSAETEGEFWGSEESAATGRQERVRPTRMVCATAYVPLPETCVCWCRCGLVLEHGVWRADSWGRQLLAVKTRPERTGVRTSTTGSVCGRRASHHRSRAPLLSGVQRVGPPLQHPSPCTRPCLWRH